MGLMDKMKTSVTGATEKQKYASTIKKVSGQIEICKKEIVRLTEQVGNQCVANHLGQTDTEYEELFAAIRVQVAQIQQAEAAIKRLKTQQAEEESARQQALQEKEAADRAARQKAQEEKQAARQKAQEEKQAAKQQAQQQKEAAKQQALAEAEAAKQRELEEQQRQEAARRAEQQRLIAQLNATSKVCTECGKRNELDAKFCVYCGHVFDVPSPQEAATPEEELKTMPETTPEEKPEDQAPAAAAANAAEDAGDPA